MVTGIILHQCDSFSEEDIYSKVEKWCEGSAFDTKKTDSSSVQIKQTITKTIERLFNEMCLKPGDKEHTYKLSMSFPSV